MLGNYRESVILSSLLLAFCKASMFCFIAFNFLYIRSVSSHCINGVPNSITIWIDWFKNIRCIIYSLTENNPSISFYIWILCFGENILHWKTLPVFPWSEVEMKCSFTTNLKMRKYENESVFCPNFFIRSINGKMNNNTGISYLLQRSEVCLRIGIEIVETFTRNVKLDMFIIYGEYTKERHTSSHHVLGRYQLTRHYFGKL